MGAGARIGPGTGMHTVLEQHTEQRMPSRVKDDFVAAIAVAIERFQLRRIGIGEKTKLDRLGIAAALAERVQVFDRPARALARDTLTQRRVGGEEIIARERRRLVEDVVGLKGGGIHIRLGHWIQHLSRVRAACQAHRGMLAFDPGYGRDRIVAEEPHHIVVVGAGAGGLELATRLGDKLGKRGTARVTLIERSRTHLWKPLLHEIAAGSMDLSQYETDLIAQSHWHHFRFRYGAMCGLDRARREVKVAATHDDEGLLITPAQPIPYDTLIIAVGGHTNDFGTIGAKENAISLDTPEEAARFNRRLINACLRAHTQPEAAHPARLHVAIIGAGATGVELAAELHRTTRVAVAYGMDGIDPKRDLRITVIEAADRILPALPERLSAAAEDLLGELGVDIMKAARVQEVKPGQVALADGRVIEAELIVWAAGVKAPAFLRDLDGLETNGLNQLVVEQSLQTTRDPNVFALGDCAACPWPGHTKGVPPRAQAAHQQASHMVRQMRRRLAGEPLQPYTYRDFGSLVSLGAYSTIGNLMGRLVGGELTIEGYFARLMYMSLYKQHELALHGFVKVAMDTVARTITRRTEPHVKLH